MRLEIADQARNVIYQDSEQAFPNEACGFLFGIDKRGKRLILEAVKVLNGKVGDQTRRFKIDASDYTKAEAYAERNGLTLLGVYHSHPLHPAIASEYDLKYALPFFSYVITSIGEEGYVQDIKSWQLNEQYLFDEEKIEEPIFNYQK